MAYSNKSYSKTAEFMEKFVNASEGEVIYGIGHTRFMALAKEAGAIYKIGNTALVNTELFEEYLENFREPARTLPKHMYERLIN